jgi:hypothetical protein
MTFTQCRRVWYRRTDNIILGALIIIAIVTLIAIGDGDVVLIVLGSTLIFAVSAGLYLLPTIVAFLRQHHNRWAILLLNIFLGWTFLGWVAALIWSATFVRSVQ